MNRFVFLCCIIALLLLQTYAQDVNDADLILNEEEIQVDESVTEMAAELGLDSEKEREFQEIMNKLKAAGFGNSQVFRGGSGGGAMSQEDIIRQLGGDPKNKMNLDENDVNVERLSKRERRKAKKSEKKAKKVEKKSKREEKKSDKKSDKQRRRSSKKSEL